MVAGFHGDGAHGIAVFRALVANSPLGAGIAALDMGMADLSGDGF